ncbi:MAG: hypothetical protein ACI4QX_04810 [Lachnospiraceae bacterium]
MYQEKEVVEKIGTVDNMYCLCFMRESSTMQIVQEYIDGISSVDDNLKDTKVIPINEEYFSSDAFRRILEEKYNMDGKEGLSLKERENVLILNFMDSVRMYGETLDGLEYFPNLTDVYFGKVERLVIENHPSIKVIGGETSGLKKVVIRNCPNLETVDLDLSEVEEVGIEGCEKLQ